MTYSTDYGITYNYDILTFSSNNTQINNVVLLPCGNISKCTRYIYIYIFTYIFMLCILTDD